MKEIYTVIAIIIFGCALRSCRTVVLRKLGALVILLVSGLCFYFLTGSVLYGISAAATWFFLPWVELLTRIRKMRMPLENKLQQKFPANTSLFPRADNHILVLEKLGFEHVRDCGWNFGGVEQLYRLYWNAGTRAVCTLHLCEQSSVTFSYLSVTSRDNANGIWRTTNFPFSPTLKLSPDVHWNQISCANDCTTDLLGQHCGFLKKQGFIDDDLSIPDPGHLEEEIEHELRRQIDHNLQKGIICLTGDGNFRYTLYGLFYLWKQFVRDMVRLC